MFKSSKKVVYYFDEEYGTFTYSTAHPMKPLRVAMTDELIRQFGMHKHLTQIVILSIINTKGPRVCAAAYHPGQRFAAHVVP
jgi:acetoin utilization deacetylase AcuC-like enzyme